MASAEEDGHERVGAVEPTRPVDRAEAAQMLAGLFLANTDAGRHSANDEVIAEILQRMRRARYAGDRER